MATTFQYAVRDRSGKLVSGTLDGPNQAAVVSKLRSMGFAPVKVEKANVGMKRDVKIPGFSKRVKLKDLAIFSRQFATMINSGLSLLRALAILAEQTDNPELRRIVAGVRTDVETGSSLSVAMSKYPRVFPPLMVNMTRAGEVGGFLDTAMLQVAENYEAEVKLRGKVKAAMTYPVVVFILAILMCTAMLLFIVPVFAKMFKQLHGTLPAPTRMLIAVSHGLKFGAPLLLIATIAFLVWWSRYKQAPAVRNVVDPLKLKVPVFGMLFKKIALSRFSRNLGTMMKCGVPILQSLDIVADTTGSVVVARAVHAVQDSVRQGESLARPLSDHPVFPPMVVQMMAVGEDTGALDTMLLKISQFYDQEVEATTQQLTALIEPLMIAFLGSVVGSMIIALYMPIFNIFKLIN
jgi:type IV pilus assembly protein PilC